MKRAPGYIYTLNLNVWLTEHSWNVKLILSFKVLSYLKTQYFAILLKKVNGLCTS